MVDFAYYGDKWERFVPDSKGLSAEDEYQALTQKVIEYTGYETLNADEQGNLIPREDREVNFRNAVRFVNDQLKLGLDHDEKEMLTLVYTALSEVPRFGENEHIPAAMAGNTGTHSIHTPLRANLLIRRALEATGEEESRESVLLRQVTGLCLMPHDLGESLGEPGSLAQEDKHVGFKKDKPAAEGLVMNGILRLAAHAVERGDYSLFYDKLDEMKISDMKTTAPAQSNEEFLAQIKDKLGVPPEISIESEGRVSMLSDFWQMQEHKGRVPSRFQGADEIHPEFIRQLAGLCEHMQGEGHFLHFAHKGDAPTPEGEVSWKLVRSSRQIGNIKYNEGEVGNLFAEASTPLEHAIALEAKKEAYEKSIDFLKEGAAAVDRTATASDELQAGDPGRADEIASLVARSEAEGREKAEAGIGEHVIRDVETKERLVAMYEWAITNDDFIPEPGQVLLKDPPAEFKHQEKSFVAALEGETQQQAAGRGA